MEFIIGVFLRESDLTIAELLYVVIVTGVVRRGFSLEFIPLVMFYLATCF